MPHKSPLSILLALLVCSLAASAEDGAKGVLLSLQCEEKVQQIQNNPATDWRLTSGLKEGQRGNGIHYDWMDKLVAHGIKEAVVKVSFHYASNRTDAQVARIWYLKEYLKFETDITDPAILAPTRDSLNQIVSEAALQRAQIEIPVFVKKARLDQATGSVEIGLFDNECVPPLEDMPDLQDPLETALMRAVTKHDLQGVREQLQKGADVNAKDGQGTTALMIAAAVAYVDEPDALEILRLLLDSGAKVNERTGGSTALNGAANGGDVRVVRELLARGADVNAGRDQGMTPLMAAAYHEYFDVVKELVYAGADVCAKSKEGKTALDMVEGRSIGRKPDHDAIVAFLKSRMPPK